MRVSTPTNIFFSPPIESSVEMLHFEKKEHETFSQNEYPSFKKARIGEAVVCNPIMPSALNNVMSSNSVTRLCQKFGLGHEDQFLFAYGTRDIPKQFTSTLNGDQKMIEELQLCKMFYHQRNCKYKERCRFLHVNPERVKEDLGLFKDRSAIRIGTGGSSGDRRSGSSSFACNRVNSKPVMWKRKLCRNWEKIGGCLYGQMCYFAHGQAELRALASHNALIVPQNISSTFSTVNDQYRTTTKGQVQGKNSEFKCRELAKINGIYADWIGDMPLSPSSLNGVKN